MSATQDALRGTVTVLFTDVEGSTDLGERAGDEQARKVLRVHDEVVRASVERHGGREVKSLGDGLMAAFSSARRAVTCAVDVQCKLAERRSAEPELLPVRIGLNTGEALEEEGDLFGSAVSAAARICAKARGGEILVSEVVKALTGTLPDASFREKGRFRLKGFDERWRLFEVLWQQAEAPDPVRFARTPFVGRDAERARLRAALDDAARGRGSLVMIGGEPGVGKTRLSEEVLDDARRRDMRTLIGRSYETETPAPYGPFLEVLEMAGREVDPATFRLALGDAAGEIAKIMPQLRTMYDDIPPPLELPPEQERRYLFNSIAEFVTRAASARPLVVLLDDLHWADEPSLLLLQHIAQVVPDTSLMLLGTYRDVELDVGRPLASALDALLRRRLATRVALKRLAEASVAQMLHKLSGRPAPKSLVDAIFLETDGNAFFVEEVYKHLAEEGRLFDPTGEWRTDLTIDELEVPEGVRLVIGRRLQRMSEATRRALTVAAVVGRTFDYRLVERVEEVSPDELLDAVDEAEQAGLITEAGREGDVHFMFVHELIRQTLLSTVALPRRQRFHLRVAEAMESLYADSLDERAGELAHHFYQAGAAADPAKTIKYMRKAGDRALDGAAFEDGLRYFEEAMKLANDDSSEDYAELLYGLGRAQRSLGRLDEAVATWREALAAFDRLGRVDRFGLVAGEMGVELGWAARWNESVEAASQALGALGDDAGAERARLLGLVAIAMAWGGQYEAARQMLDEARAIAEELDDEWVWGHVLAAEVVGRYAFIDDLDAAAEMGFRAAGHLRRTGELWTLATCLAFMLFILATRGRFDEVNEVLEELEPLAERLGHAGALLFAGRIRLFELSRTEGTIENLQVIGERDLEICRGNELPWLTHSYSMLGTMAFLDGDDEHALELFQRAAEVEPFGALWGFSQASWLRARAYCGALDDVRKQWSELRDALPAAGRLNTLGSWTILWFGIEALWVAGLREEAAGLYPLAKESLQYGFRVTFEGTPTELAAALAAASGGDWDAARDHMESTLKPVQDMPLRWRAGDVEMLYAEILLVKGDPSERPRARELLQDAVEEFEERGMTGRARAARDALARLTAGAA